MRNAAAAKAEAEAEAERNAAILAAWWSQYGNGTAADQDSDSGVDNGQDGEPVHDHGLYPILVRTLVSMDAYLRPLF